MKTRGMFVGDLVWVAVLIFGLVLAARGLF
jgi:hypothetical protein